MTAIVGVIALMILGVALLAIEVLLVPGVGLVGLLGIAGIGGAVWIAYAYIGPAYAGITLFAGVVTAGLALWLLPRTRAGKSMFLETKTAGRAGDPALAELEGREGKTVTPLRPSGTIEIDGRPIDVVSEGDYVERGARVRVTLVRGSRVVVEAVDEADEKSA